MHRSSTVFLLGFLVSAGAAQTCEDTPISDSSVPIKEAPAPWRRIGRAVGFVKSVCEPITNYGSGFLIDDRHFVTCAHVLRGECESLPEASAIEVWFDYEAESEFITTHCGSPGDPYHIFSPTFYPPPRGDCPDPTVWPVEWRQILSPESEFDVAILRLSPKDGQLPGDRYPPVRFGVPRPQTDSRVFCVHHPIGKCKEFSTYEGALTLDSSSLPPGWFQHRAAIWPVSSGSPVFASGGCLVAMNTAVRPVAVDDPTYYAFGPDAATINELVTAQVPEAQITDWSPPQYVLDPLDPGPGALVLAADLNDKNDVVGSVWIQGGFKASLWRDGRMTLLPSPAYFSGAAARAINNTGAITGQDLALYKPLLWQDLQVFELPTPSCNSCGGSANPSAINDLGVICGTASVDGESFPFQAFRWRPLNENWTIDPILLLDGWRENANGINQKGDMVAVSQTLSGEVKSFLVEPSLLSRDLGPSYATGINDVRQVCGQDPGFAPPSLPARFDGKSWIPLSDSGGVCLRINNLGIGIGYDGYGDARLFAAGAEYDLRALVYSPPEGWQILSALDINDVGSILVMATLDGVRRDAVLKPVPAPRIVRKTFPAP